MQTQKTMMQKLLQFEDLGISACFIKWVNMGKTWNKSDEITEDKYFVKVTKMY